MNLRRRVEPLAGLLVAGLLLAGCAGSGVDDRGPAQGSATTVPATRPGSPPAPAPTGPAGLVTLTGTVRAGVEPGCLLLEAENGGRYLLVGGERAELRPGARVVVAGRVADELLSICQQGEPLVVTEIKPAG